MVIHDRSNVMMYVHDRLKDFIFYFIFISALYASVFFLETFLISGLTDRSVRTVVRSFYVFVLNITTVYFLVVFKRRYFESTHNTTVLGIGSVFSFLLVILRNIIIFLMGSILFLYSYTFLRNTGVITKYNHLLLLWYIIPLLPFFILLYVSQDAYEEIIYAPQKMLRAINPFSSVVLGNRWHLLLISTTIGIVKLVIIVFFMGRMFFLCVLVLTDMGELYLSLLLSETYLQYGKETKRV